MGPPDSTRETEIKLKVSSAAEARRILKGAGFRVERRRVREQNCVFDTADGSLGRAGVLLRVRQAGPRATLTYKGRAIPGKHKSRQELEIEISDAFVLGVILEKLGFRPVFRYEKFRTEYTLGARGVVTLDETPVGCYLEIEGAPGWIDRTSRRLGFRESDYITASYGQLYLAFCKANSARPADMVFAGKVFQRRDAEAPRNPKKERPEAAAVSK